MIGRLLLLVPINLNDVEEVVTFAAFLLLLLVVVVFLVLVRISRFAGVEENRTGHDLH